MKKPVSILLAALTAATCAISLAGCGDSDYPVEIANYKIENEPENVVVLDPATADIMSYIGYDRKFAGRSNIVDQENLNAAPDVGTPSNPDVDEIAKLETDLVFSNDDLTQGSLEKLESKGIQVIKLQQVKSTAEVKTNYETVGKILGGNITGKKAGLDAYNKLIEELDKQKRDIEELSGSGALNTVCYLYLEDGQLMQMTSGSFGNILIGYTNCVNVAVNIDQNTVDPATLAGANPDYIFYDDEATFAAIESNSELKDIGAVKNKKCAQIPRKNLSRPGETAVETLKQMIDFIYKDNSAGITSAQPDTKPSASQPATQPASQKATQAATQATTQATTQAASQAETQPATTQPATQAETKAEEDLSGKYKIKLSGLSLEKEDESDDVQAMQQRLYDLGYVDDKENITGYYGDVTEQAIKDFQKKNGIKETGTADNATLTAMFKSSAKKA